MVTAAADRWEIVNDGEHVEVRRNGVWFSDADDVYDAIGICQGQRATEVDVDDDGHRYRRSL